MNNISRAERSIDLTFVNTSSNVIPQLILLPCKRMKVEFFGLCLVFFYRKGFKYGLHQQFFVFRFLILKITQALATTIQLLLILDYHTSHFALEEVAFFRPIHSDCIHMSFNVFYALTCKK